MARQSLIDGIVDNFKHHVMQATSVVGISNVHAWTFANGLQAFQHFDGFSTIPLSI
jgi:hypothetical protein